MNNKGRYWRIDDEGNITNDAHHNLIDPIFYPIISAVKQKYLEKLGDKIHSIYLTGSISRGLAIALESDLDVFAVLNRDIQIEHEHAIKLASISILNEYPVVSDVQMEIWPWDYVFPENNQKTFTIGSFIIKTHSVCIHGNNLANIISNFKLSKQIALDDIVQIKSDIEEALFEVRKDSSPVNIRYWCKRIMKNIVRTGFSLVMNKEHCFTRDLSLSSVTFSKYYPDQKEHMNKALSLIHNPTSSVDELRIFLSQFGQWIIFESEKWMKEHE